MFSAVYALQSTMYSGQQQAKSSLMDIGWLQNQTMHVHQLYLTSASNLNHADLDKVAHLIQL